MLRSLAGSCVGISLFALLLLPQALADGDPLEVYDFTGKVPVSGFVQQSRTQIFQHGLWTVQHFVEMNPFAGKTWDLRGNSTEKVNVYYGSRPMWSSAPCYRASVSSLGLSREGEAAPKFISVQHTSEHEGELTAVDCTGRDGITLVVGSWSGGVNRGHSTQLIRLSGKTPKEAQVEVLWSGLYEQFEDLDGDGDFEILDKDWVHDRASYVPALGFWTAVVLTWDVSREEYVLAHGDLLRSKAQTGGSEVWSHEVWRAKHIERVRAATQKMEAELAGGGTGEEARQKALFTLANSLTYLLWAGDLNAARALYAETELKNYASMDGDEAVTRDVWWTTFITGCKTSRYWVRLCASYPSLLEL